MLENLFPNLHVHESTIRFFYIVKWHLFAVCAWHAVDFACITSSTLLQLSTFVRSQLLVIRMLPVSKSRSR